MNEATHHRGPDQTGVQAFSHVTIGNNRLAIIDLTPLGKQPLSSPDGRYTIVYNGEIYNHREIRAELEALGETFVGHSDTEVLVHAFARYGTDVVTRLRGMWAFAIHDSKRDTLTLSRDHFGIKPLYLYDDGKHMAFSSEIRGLLADPKVTRKVNPRAIDDLIRMGYVIAPETILANVRSVLPGEIVIVDLKTMKSTRRISKLESASDALPTDDALEAALRDSVKHHVIADVPVGLFFSGGIDSSVLAATLSSLSIPMTGYHVAIGGKTDTEYARAIAKAFDIPLKERTIDPSEISPLFEGVMDKMDQPLADSSLLPTLLVSELAKGDVKVVLSGEGGDELFAGYPRAKRLAGLHADIAAMKMTSFGRSVVKSLLGNTPLSAPLLRFSQSVLRRLERLADDPVGLYVAEVGIFAGQGADADMRKKVSMRLAEREGADGALALDRLLYLPDDLLLKIDTATMAHSIEGRVPFLDKEVFRLVGGAPLTWKQEGGVSKAPLRRLLRKRLSSELVDRKKQGFSLPVLHYLTHEGRERMNEALKWYLETSDERDALVRRVFTALKNGNDDDALLSVLSYSVYALVVAHAFIKKHRLTV